MYLYKVRGIIFFLAVVQVMLGSVCEDGWFNIGDKCYVVIPIPKTFPEAILLCKTDSFGGEMVELETPAEKQALVAHMRTSYELIFGTQLFWVGAKGGKMVFLWNSGLPVAYPDYVPGSEELVGCLAFGIPTLDRYLVDQCTKQNLVICEKSRSGNTTTSSTGTMPVG